MKIKAFLILIFCLILCGCNNIKNNNDSKPVENISNKINEQETYIDDNPIKLSMYVDNINPGYTKIENEYHSVWKQKEDIVVFGCFYSTKENLRNDYFQDVWYEEASIYEKFLDYKIGWNISFSLNNGEKIDKTILKPSDTESFYDYLEIYLYDSANVPKDIWYSHLLDSDIKDNTLLTSMKLTAGTKYNEISDLIKVEVFTYKSINDFSKNGKYRGNSINTVIVHNE